MDREEYTALVRVQREYLDRIEEHTRVTAALIRQMHRDWLGERTLPVGGHLPHGRTSQVRFLLAPGLPGREKHVDV